MTGGLLWRLFRSHIKNYFRVNRFSIFITIGLFFIGAMEADSQLRAQPSCGLADYFIILFQGSYPFAETQNGIFRLPLTWFMLLYFCVYTAVVCPAHEQDGVSQQYLLRAQSRSTWWMCKCFSLACWVVFYFFLGAVCLLGFMLTAGRPLRLSSTLVPNHTAWMALCFLPVLFALLSATFCLCCCQWISFWLTQALAITNLVLVAFVEIPYFPGNYSMLIRSRFLTPDGWRETQGIFLHIIFIILLWMCGNAFFQKMDILPKKKGDINEN